MARPRLLAYRRGATVAVVESPRYVTPTECALGGWANTPAAETQVIAVDVRGAKAQVLVVVGHEEDWVDCWQDENGWHEASSGNGPNQIWFGDADTT